MLHFNFIVFVILPLLQQSLLNGAPVSLTLDLQLLIDCGYSRLDCLPLELILVLFLEVTANSFVVAADWPLVPRRKVLLRL